MSDEPWKDVLSGTWKILTEGKRKYVTIPVFLVVTAIAILAATKNNISGLIPKTETTKLSHEEHDVYDGDEWVLQIADDTDPQSLKDLREKLRDFCAHMGYVAEDKERLSAKDFLIVRSPFDSERYILVIDIYGEERSNKELYERTLRDILNYKNDRISKDELHNYFGSATVIQCTKAKFQKAHGRISG